MDALAPELELGMLRLEHFSAGFGMLPVVKAMAIVELKTVVVALDLLDFQAIVPRKEESRFRATIVLDVALAADERAHLLARRIDIGIVRRGSLPCSPPFDGRDVRQGFVACRKRLNSTDKSGA